jgi:cytidylate kinase
VIAIDGPAGSGKSTTSRAVAGRLGYTYVDTGAMYRAVTLAALRANVPPREGEPLDRLLAALALTLAPTPSGTRVLLDGADVSEAIRNPHVTGAVSAYSAIPSVREALVRLQRALGREGGVVVEGRDIGTVVFPDAELKIYLDADLDERARRRAKDLERSGHRMPEREIAGDIARRDAADSSRDVSPLSRAPDAVLLDTSGLTFDEQVDALVRLARERLA